MQSAREPESPDETQSPGSARWIAALKSTLFTVLVPGTVVVVVPSILLSSRELPPPAPSPLLRILGAIVVLAGLSLYVTCLAGFVRHGLGSPSPTDPPKRLVVGGPYRLTRNPMYVAVLSVILGEAALFRSSGLLIYAALLAIAFHVFVVVYEEPALARAFGADYEAYRASVRRWIGFRSPLPRRGDD